MYVHYIRTKGVILNSQSLSNGLVTLFTGVIFVFLNSGCSRSTAKSRTTDNNTANTIQKLRLGYFPNVTHAAAILGIANGTFGKSLGPNVKIEEAIFNAGPAEIEALFSDQIDIGFIGPGPAINGFLKSRGKALRIIAGASSGGVSLVIRPDVGIKTISDLNNKRVADPQTGGTQDISLRFALLQANLKGTDKGGTVSIQPMQNADTLTLFKKKEIDAAWVPEPWVTRLVTEVGGHILIDERELWKDKKFSTAVVVVRSKFLEEHPDLVEKFLDGYVETVQWIQANPSKLSPLVLAQIKRISGKTLPEKTITEALSRTEITTDSLRNSIYSYADRSKLLGYQHVDHEGIKAIIDLKWINKSLKSKHLPEYAD